MSLTLKPYSEYKDSGLPWLGDIPAHWEVLPNRALFEEVNDRNHPEEQLLSVTIGKGVIQQSDLLAGTSKKDSSNEDKVSYKLVQPGDITYNKMRAWQGAVGVSDYRGIVSPAYIVVRPRGDQTPDYFHYLLRTPGFAKEAERWSYGIASDQWSLRADDFKQIYCSRPPKEEQERIVRFLAHADRRVSGLIRAKRQLLALLNEQKQAIIHQAVTRGLDENVRLKPSGIEWLGEVPENWEVRRLKTVARIRYGLGQPPKEVSSGIPFVRATNVERGKIVSKGLVFVDPSDVPSSRDAFLREGEIIVVRSGAYTADSAIIPSDYAGSVAGYDMVLTVLGAEPKFVSLALLSKYVLVDQLLLQRARAAQPHLNAEELGVCIILLPPPNVQQAIVEAVERDTRTIEAAMSRARREIDFVREYRTRLVADVVTGKLDVRGAQLPALEEDEALEDWEEVGEEEADEIAETEEMADADE